MFHMLFEHFSVCQSLLTEQRRPPTGGLSEAKKSLGGGFPCPCPLGRGQKQPLEPLLLDFPMPVKNNWVQLGMDCPP